MHITFRCFELRIAKVAPQNATHSEFVRLSKGLADFSYLTRRLVRTKIYRGAHSDSAKIMCFLHSSKQHLIELVRQRQQLVVIDLHDERNLVSILPGN